MTVGHLMRLLQALPIDADVVTALDYQEELLDIHWDKDLNYVHEDNTLYLVFSCPKLNQ